MTADSNHFINPLTWFESEVSTAFFLAIFPYAVDPCFIPTHRGFSINYQHNTLQLISTQNKRQRGMDTSNRRIIIIMIIIIISKTFPHRRSCYKTTSPPLVH